MVWDNKPIECGNAVQITEKSTKAKFLMDNYEEIVDFYSSEPPIITLYIGHNGEPYVFEQILRIRRWVPNIKASSWCIYSEERNWKHQDPNSVGGIIIRKVTWDRMEDLKRYKLNPQIERSNWPTLNLENHYLSLIKSNDLLDKLVYFDNLIYNGISLTERPDFDQNQKWDELEVRRCFDWGSVQTLWHPYMTNENLEIAIERLDHELNDIIMKQSEPISKMELDYTILPQYRFEKKF